MMIPGFCERPADGQVEIRRFIVRRAVFLRVAAVKGSSLLDL